MALNVKSAQHLALEFERMMKLPDVTAIMVQPMLKGHGTLLAPSTKKVWSCGSLWFGRYLVEVLKDVSSGSGSLVL